MALCCCGGLFGYAFVDVSLREVGILPTYTPAPTETLEPTHTATPKPTATPSPTSTTEPTATPRPTSTATSTATPLPTQTAPPSPTAIATQTAVPTNIPAPTIAPADTPIPQPTVGIEPTAVPPPAPGGVVITGVNKRAEYVDLLNQGGSDIDLTNWVLVSEKGPQSCTLSGVIPAGQSLRVWAMAEDVGQGGFNCGFGSDIWNNSERDPAVLYDSGGVEVSRW